MLDRQAQLISELNAQGIKVEVVNDHQWVLTWITLTATIEPLASASTQLDPERVAAVIADTMKSELIRRAGGRP